MSFVLRRADTQEYLTIGPWWNTRWSADINEARTFKRRCDAANSANARLYSRGYLFGTQVLPVKLVLA